MNRYIDADKLMEFANNTKDKTIDANDIARFPTADVEEVGKCKDCKYNHECLRNIIRSSKDGGVIYCPLEYCSEWLGVTERG